LSAFYHAYNKKQEAILNEIIADDYLDYGHQPPGRGAQGAKSDHQEIACAFEDARFDIATRRSQRPVIQPIFSHYSGSSA
jgi:hypothetical protein